MKITNSGVEIDLHAIMVDEDLVRFGELFKTAKEVYVMKWDTRLKHWTFKRPEKGMLNTKASITTDFYLTTNGLQMKMADRETFLEFIFSTTEVVEEEEGEDGEGESATEMQVGLCDQGILTLKSVFAWSLLSNGEKMLYMKSSDDYEVYDTIHEENAMSVLLAYNPKTFDKMEQRFKNCPSLRVVRKANPESRITAITQDIGTWWKTKKIWLKIQEDERLRISEPIAITNNPKTAAFSCFDLVNLKSGPTPAFDKWLTQIQPELLPVFKAWIYSIFVEENRGRQMLFMRDSGYTGKSTFINTIFELMTNRSCVGVSKGSLEDKFWGSKIFGKRLVSFSDSGNTKIQQMDKLKQLSGSDPIDVEYKGEKSFTYRPNCKVIVATNSHPEVNLHEVHQRTRIIFIPLTPTKDINELKKFCALDADGNLELDRWGGHKVIGSSLDVDMKNEFMFFLESCAVHYKALCPNHKEIILPDAHYEGIEAKCASDIYINVTETMETFLEITKDPADRVKISTLGLIIDKVKDTYPITKNDLHRYLGDQGCEKGVYKVNGIATRGFTNLRLRPEWEIKNLKLVAVKQSAAVATPAPALGSIT